MDAAQCAQSQLRAVAEAVQRRRSGSPRVLKSPADAEQIPHRCRGTSKAASWITASLGKSARRADAASLARDRSSADAKARATTEAAPTPKPPRQPKQHRRQSSSGKWRAPTPTPRTGPHRPPPFGLCGVFAFVPGCGLCGAARDGFRPIAARDKTTGGASTRPAFPFMAAQRRASRPYDADSAYAVGIRVTARLSGRVASPRLPHWSHLRGARRRVRPERQPPSVAAVDTKIVALCATLESGSSPRFATRSHLRGARRRSCVHPTMPLSCGPVLRNSKNHK